MHGGVEDVENSPNAAMSSLDSRMPISSVTKASSMVNGWTQRMARSSRSQVRPTLSDCVVSLIRVVDPATSEELGQVADVGVSQTKQAIEAASAAFKTWSKTTPKV